MGWYACENRPLTAYLRSEAQREVSGRALPGIWGEPVSGDVQVEAIRQVCCQLASNRLQLLAERLELAHLMENADNLVEAFA
jgi:hypothetical protein